MILHFPLISIYLVPNNLLFKIGFLIPFKRLYIAFKGNVTYKNHSIMYIGKMLQERAFKGRDLDEQQVQTTHDVMRTYSRIFNAIL